jgi:hypothetical protein
MRTTSFIHVNNDDDTRFIVSKADKPPHTLSVSVWADGFPAAHVFLTDDQLESLRRTITDYQMSQTFVGDNGETAEQLAQEST